MADIKWSAFPNGGTMVAGDQLVGLRSGANTRLTPVIPAQIQQSAFNFAALAGSSNAFTVSLSPTIAALTDGMIVTFYSGAHSNTIAAPTLSVDGLTAVTIVCWSGGLAPNDITTNTEYLCIYNLTDNVFQLVNPSISTANTFEVQSNDYNYATDTGIANAYIANIQPAQLTNNSGLFVVMTAIHANTAASTLTVNGVTHPILLSNGSALVGGEITVNGLYYFIYSSALTSFILINSNLSSSPAPSLTNTGLVLTGANGLVDGQQFIYNYASLSYLGFFVPNALNVAVSATGTGLGWTTVNLGYAQSSTGMLIDGASLTSWVADSLRLVAGTINIAVAPTFTTLSLNSLQMSGTIYFSAAGITSLSLPQFLSGLSLTLTTATALTTINMPLLQTMTGSITGTANALTTFTLTNFNILFANYTLTSNALTTLSMPAMVTISGNFAPVATSLTTLNLPALVTVTGTFSMTLASLTTLTLTSLQTLTGGFSPSFAALTTLSLPAIVTISTLVAITAANMTTFSMGATLKTVAGNWTMTGMKLDQASVDGILVSLAALDGTGGTTAYSSKTVNLSGGTSSAPSATGLAAKVTLVARGCTVTTN